MTQCRQPLVRGRLKNPRLSIILVRPPCSMCAGHNPEVMRILQTQPVFLFIRALRALAPPSSQLDRAG